MARDYTAVPWEYLDEMEELTDEEFGRLIRQLLRYSRSGEAFSPSGNERFYIKRVQNREIRYQDNYSDLSDIRSDAGKKGANSRWNGKTMANDGKNDFANGKNSKAIFANGKNGYTETETKTETNTEPDIHPPNPPLKGEAFERFWAVYPKKVGKQAAFKAFQRIKGVSVETMVKAVEYQRSTAQWQKDNGRFIPNPATWLNQGRWEDENTEPSAVCQTEDTGLGYAAPVDRGDLDWLLGELAKEDGHAG